MTYTSHQAQERGMNPTAALSSRKRRVLHASATAQRKFRKRGWQPEVESPAQAGRIVPLCWHQIGNAARSSPAGSGCQWPGAATQWRRGPLSDQPMSPPPGPGRGARSSGPSPSVRLRVDATERSPASRPHARLGGRWLALLRIKARAGASESAGLGLGA